MDQTYTSPFSKHAHRNDGTTGRVAAGVAGFGLGLLAGAARKAAVQAPTYAAGDWYEGLKAEHKLARTLLEKLAETGEDEQPQRAALVLQLQHAIGKHTVEEEFVIYCVLREHGEAAEADALHADHGQLKQGLWDLEMIGKKQQPGFLERLAEVRAAFETHVREEEDEIFPALREKLDKETNTKVTQRMNREGFKVA
jgi:hemerythrin-like domain-containing protein